MKYIQNLKQLRTKDVAMTGGKAVSLGMLIQKGFLVPSGFVVRANACKVFMKDNALTIYIAELENAVAQRKSEKIKKLSRKLQSRITQGMMSPAIEKEILDAYRALGATRVAVRSSATVEDGLTASWAGQLETYLNVTSDDLLMNIKRAWASLFSANAMQYALQNKQSSKMIGVGVVVQAMVQSEVSGIAFSINPVTQNINECVIEAHRGLGEDIVGGKIIPDTYRIQKTSRHVIKKDTHGKNVALPDLKILALSDMVLKIEKMSGHPCDVEWAFSRGKFFILQNRPITTLDSPKTATPWISLGRRETTLLEASIKIEAWSKILKTQIGRGYHAYAIDSDGNYFTTETDEEAIWKAAQRTLKTKYFLETTTAFDARIESSLNKKNGIAKALDLMVVQFGHFLKDRMHADILFKNPKTSHAVRDAIAIWRNDPLLFSSHEVVVSAIAKKFHIPKKFVELSTISELKKMFQNRSYLIQNRKTILARQNNWRCTLLDGTITVGTKITDVSPSRTADTIQGNVAFGTGIFTGIAGKNIWVVAMTEPKDIAQMKKYDAIITDQGGVLSHAAIICRELKKPCIIGTVNATKILQKGMWVSMNLKNGEICILDRKK